MLKARIRIFVHERCKAILDGRRYDSSGPDPNGHKATVDPFKGRKTTIGLKSILLVIVCKSFEVSLYKYRSF